MTDLFADKARDWDERPVPAQISQGVGETLVATVPLDEGMTVLDFGAGTGLLCARLAPRVGRILAVDVSRSMLDALVAKAELKGKVEAICQDILTTPLGATVDLVVSAMAMHHVKDTRALLQTLYDHLTPGGGVALADLDAEDGDFHPPDTEGVYHAGFDREALGALAAEVGFVEPSFVTACEVTRDDKAYPIFLLTASKPGAV